MEQARLRCLSARLLARWHLVSLDAPSVAIAWAYAMAWAAHVHLQFWIGLLLGTGTWTVYVLDRVLDAHRGLNAYSAAFLRERHYFHWRHRRVLIPLAVCSGIAAAAIFVRLIPPTAREHDSVVAAAAIAYFSGVHSSARFPHAVRRLCSKEMLVGVLFAAGCAAPTLSRIRSGSALPITFSFVFFAATAWLNCAAISSWEAPMTPSLDISAASVMICLTGFAAALVLPPQFGRTSALFISGAISALMIAALHRLRDRVDAITLRALADFVLLAPAILFISRVWPG